MYGRVAYRQIYSGIDLVYYGADRRLEFDFVVAPGADPELIALRLEGADRLTLDASGDLLVAHDGTELADPPAGGLPGGRRPASARRGCAARER